MRLFILMPILLVSGCVSESAVCDAAAQNLASHAAALAETPDDLAAVTGANLIETIDAACGQE